MVKITIACKSLLLKRSLELMLKDNITAYNECDLVISDKKINIKKKLFIINHTQKSNIHIPFTKQVLLKSLEVYLNVDRQVEIPKQNKKDDFNKSFEDKLQNLANTFVKDIVQLYNEK